MRKLFGSKTAGAALALLAATAIALPAQTFTTVHSFDYADGSELFAPLIQGIDGNLYGTTYAGGTSGEGTAFKITPGGTLTTLHSFYGLDGISLSGALVQGINGAFYGTAYWGGNDVCYNGCGTVFEITSGGTFSVLHSFDNTDGANPNAGLTQAADQNFYGTTFEGGDFGCNPLGCGTIFKITPSGTLTTLHIFEEYADGDFPEAPLIQATDGNLYGTTESGGSNGINGTVFRISLSGTLTMLHHFDGLDGANPYAGLVQANDGEFYGTTVNGGAYRHGTVFKITPSGTLTTLYSFCRLSNCSDGSFPYGAVVQGTDGDLYGTTQYGGANGLGTVFRISPPGTFATLYSFCSETGCADGDEPLAALVQATDGNFYGTTYEGGANDEGTVFSLSMGLAPFVETQPTLGPVGIPVKILGTNLTGATSVTFNGTPAVFNVLSPSLIGARVPAGATTGTVQVVTPGGTLSSNVPFRVRQ